MTRRKSTRTSREPSAKTRRSASSRGSSAPGDQKGAEAPAAKAARVIAIANQKGGVGKSTTAVSLGAALAELGHRVLVADLDPQGNASTGLGIRHEAREVTAYDVLSTEVPIERAIVPTAIEGLFAIPSTIDLAGAEIELVSQFSREGRMARAIDPLRTDSYDFIFLDCPPSLGLLTVNALVAAEELIVPIQCEYYALEGLGQLLRNVRLVQQNVNPKLRLTGIVLTMFDPRTKLAEQVVTEVRKFFGRRVYDTVIPRSVRLSEAPGYGQPITTYDPRSRGAETYRLLAREVAARQPSEEPLPIPEEAPSAVVMPGDAPAGPRPVGVDPVEEEEKESPGQEPVAEAPAADERPEPEAARAEPEVSRIEPEAAARGPEPPEVERVVQSPWDPLPPEGPEGPEDEPVRAAPAAKEPDHAAAQAEDVWEPAEGQPPDGDVDERSRLVIIDVSAEGAGAARDEPQPRRRWRLFRKGGG